MSHLTKLIALAIALFPLAAGAVPYKGNNVYRSTYQGNNYLILSGTASGTIDFYAPNTKTSYRYVGADACGWASIKLPDGVTVSNFKVNGTAANPYGATATSTNYNCNSTYQDSNFSGSSAYNANIKTYYWKGTARQAVTFEWVQPALRRARLNGCGFYQLKLNSTSGNIVVGSTIYNLATLPVAPNLPLCRTIGNTSVPYVPDSYNN